MSQLSTFASVRILLPDSWVDVSSDMPEGTPHTLAKRDGVGTLQFFVGRHTSDPAPQVSSDDLEAMLNEFGTARSLGMVADVERGKCSSHYVGGSFLGEEELTRVWFLTNGPDVAFVTYVTTALFDAAAELADAGVIVRSISFD